MEKQGVKEDDSPDAVDAVAATISTHSTVAEAIAQKSSGGAHSRRSYTSQLFSPVAPPELSDDERAVVAKDKSSGGAWNRGDLSDEPAQSRAVPRTMQMGAQLQLHSHLAINLFRGRRGDIEKGVRPIIGLARFARQVAQVWSAAELDDPYADQCLVDIESAHNDARVVFRERESGLSDLLNGLEGLTVGLQTSVQPAVIDLQFYCPWSYRAAILLLQFDRIVRLSLTANHVGFIGSHEWTAVVGDSGRLMRHMLAIPNRWVYTGVTRNDFWKNTKVAKRAIGIYSEIKENRLVMLDEVLNGDRRAAIAPKNRPLEKHRTATKDEVKRV